jgi:SAM-dependent methyltransferase
MKAWALTYLCCPRSRAPLALEDERREGDEIVAGRLISPEGHEYAITQGVPRLTVDHVSSAEAETIDAFGKQWDAFNTFEGFMASADLLFHFFPMLKAEDFAGRVVLDAGCGMGRFLVPVSAMRPRHVIGLDYSSSVFHAQRHTQHLANVTVVQGSILQPPFRPGVFDRIFSAGVIDHLDDPQGGVKQLREVLTPGGLIAVWIYAHEGNETYLRLVRPLRRIGPKLPAKMLYALSAMLAAPVWLHSRTLNHWVGVRKDGSFRLPMAGYFALARNLRYRDIMLVIYDQLSHPLVNYMRKNEAEALFKNATLSLDALHAPRQNSWSLAGRRF